MPWTQGPRSQARDHLQYFRNQVARNSNFRRLERDVAAMAHNFAPILIGLS